MAVIYVATSVVFFLIHLAPGDPLNFLIGEERAEISPGMIEALKRDFGLDKPLYEQYFIYLSNVLRLNLGYSFVKYHGAAVFDVITVRLVPSFLLMAGATFLSVLLGIVMGLLSSMKAGEKSDRLITFSSLIVYSLPVFFSGIVFLLVFGFYFRVLPIGGYQSPGEMTLDARILDILLHLVGPTVVLGTVQLPIISRLTRASMLEVLQSDYITAARAKGLPTRRIILKHALRNVLITLVTMAGANISLLVMGMILTETVFNWPGLGVLLYDAILSRDYPIITGLFIFTSVFVSFLNLIIDVAYLYIDPRVVYE